MYKIAIIGCYFGKMRPDFNMWMKSCEYNETINWIIFSDQSFDYLPKNIINFKITLEEIKVMAEKKIGMEIELSNAYKLCDYKVAYGVIFEDYLADYDFWGYCDFDMVFGDIRQYFTDNILSKYDKVMHYGHLSLYRNVREINWRFSISGEKLNYKEVFSDSKIFVFDEIIGIYSFYINNKWPMKCFFNIADIEPRCRKRFRQCIDMDEYIGHKTINYNKQIYTWEQGKVYRYYYKNNKLQKEELLYLHMSGRKLILLKQSDSNRYYICTQGFIPIEGKVTLEDIEKYNNCKNVLIEQMLYYINTFIYKVKRKLKGSHSHKKIK